MKQIIDGDLVPSMVREAIHVVEEKWLGVVHLELPENITSAMINAQPFLVYIVKRPITERKAITKAINLIHALSHPLLIIDARTNHQQTQ
jgi:acetolactate synthase-1/2/3 large subunit